MVKIFEFIIDNKAGLIRKEASMLDVFKHYVEKAIKNKEHLFIWMGTSFWFFSGFRESFNLWKGGYNSGLFKEGDEKYKKKWEVTSPILIVMGRETTFETKEILESVLKDKISECGDEKIKLLKELIEKNLLSIRFFTDRRFHGKIYLFSDDGKHLKDVWVGSANFTSGGLRRNIEICAPIKRVSETEKLYIDLFYNLWKKSTTDINVLKVIQGVEREMRSGFIFLHPKIFFCKLIKFLGREDLLEKLDISAIEIDPLLLTFQRHSWQIIKNQLDKYNFSLLANSVGLGKTYNGAQAIYSTLKKNPNKKALVICPKQIMKGKDSWEDVLSKFGVRSHSDIISMGRLQKDEEEFEEIELKNYEGKYSIIIVDEIHNYRNPGSNRYKNLKKIFQKNHNALALFLSATPINLSPLDLVNEIGLALSGERMKKFTESGLLKKLKQISSLCKRKEYNKEFGKLLSSIQSEIMLRMSWKYILEKYSDDIIRLIGKEIKPDDVGIDKKEEIKVEYTYPTIYKRIVEGIIDFVDKLTYAYVMLGFLARRKELKKARQLRKWYQIQLYKRMESSLFAFYKSLKNLENKNRTYKKLVEFKISGKKEKLQKELRKLKKIAREKELFEEEEDIFIFSPAEIKRLSENLKRVSNKQLRGLLVKIEKDLEEIKRFRNLLEKYKVKNYEFEKDAKIEKLLEIVRTLKRRKKSKIVIFTQYKDTVNYIFSIISKKYKDCKVLHGDIKPDTRRGIVENFEKGELNLIISTDVMSEGINLPSADVVVNFDMPYNPARLLQRVGRALRITKPKKVIVKNFIERGEIDRQLRLFDILNIRVEEIGEYIGLDFIIWSLTEEKIKKFEEKERLRIKKAFRKFIETSIEDPEKLERSIVKKDIVSAVLSEAVDKFKITSEDIAEHSYFRNDVTYYTSLKLPERSKHKLCVITSDRHILPYEEALIVGEKSFARPDLTYITRRLNEIVRKHQEEKSLEKLKAPQVVGKQKKRIERIKEFLSSIESNCEMYGLENHVKNIKIILDNLDANIYTPKELQKLERCIERLEKAYERSIFKGADKFKKDKKVKKWLGSLFKFSTKIIKKEIVRPQMVIVYE